MMRVEAWIKDNMPLLDDELAQEALLYKEVQSVVHRGARDHGNPARLLGHFIKNFIRGWVVHREQDVLTDGKSLRRGLDAGRSQSLGKRGCFEGFETLRWGNLHKVRLSLKQDTV